MSWNRFIAILVKELRQVRRDRLTFGMMVIVPIMQLVLFGFAINNDPKQLPAALVVQDHSEFTRSLVAGLENSQYFRITERPAGVAEADELLAAGRVQFALVVPPDFSRQQQRRAFAALRPTEPPWEIRIQRRYNPEGLTSYNVIPGLIGVIPVSYTHLTLPTKRIV